MAFDRYAAIDENNRFPTPVVDALVGSTQMNTRFDSISDINPEALGSNVDLNTLVNPGVYSQTSSAGATLALNYPVAAAGRVLVLANPNLTQVTQMYFSYHTDAPRGFVRSYYNGTWGVWGQIAMGLMSSKMDIEAKELDPGVNANTLTTPGVYYESRSSDVGAASNFPEIVAGVFTVTANVAREHVHQTFITFGSATPRQWYRSRYNGTWSSWKQLVTEERLVEAIGPLASKQELSDTEDELLGLINGLSGLKAEELGDANLNDIKTAGAYSQQFSASATLALNYPRAVSGRLLVQSNQSETQVSQLYWTYDNTSSMALYARTYYNNVWREWSQISMTTGGGSGGILKGTVADGTDVNTLVEAGIYSVPTVAVANTLVNYPTKRAGIIQVWGNPDTNAMTQDVIAHVANTAPNERYSRTKITLGTTSWSPWTSPEWIKGRLGSSTAPVNGDTFRTIGAWVVAVAGDVTNMPGSGQGVLEVIFITTAGMSLQRFTERVSNDKVVVWHRYSLLVGGWSGVAWSKSGGSDAPSNVRVADVEVSDHATRVEYEASRRGGSIGTNNTAVWMWRCDHWLVAFRDKVLPIWQEFDMVGTLNVNYDNMDNVQNGGGSITWADVQGWNQHSGVEIANHGSTHTNANTMDTIYHEIVDGVKNLQKAMPLTPIVNWQEHGSAYLIATDLEGDEGLDLGRSLESFTDSYAGRLVMSMHAVVEGKIGGFYQNLTGRPQVGASHYSLDRDTADSSKVLGQSIQEMVRAFTGYIHPGLLDMVNINGSLYEATYNGDGSVDLAYPSGSSTHYNTEAEFRTAHDYNATGHIVHLPTKDFREVCRWLAEERDAGRLMIMTSTSGAFADKTHARRENLLVRSGWSGSTWTRSGEGESYTAVSSASAGAMSQGLLMYTRHGWAMGATNEMLVWAKSDVDTSLTLTFEAANIPEVVGNWKVEKTFDIPADNVLRPYRINFTIPREAPNLQMTARIAGSSITIEGEPLISAI